MLPFCFYITSTLLASSGFNKKGNYANYFRIDSRVLLRGGGCREEGVEADNASRMRVELKGMRKGVVCVGENVGVGPFVIGVGPVKRRDVGRGG